MRSRAPLLYMACVVSAGLVVLVAAVGFGGAGAQPAIAGLPTAGPITEWGLPLVRFCYNLCAVATVGTLLAAAVLAPAGSPEKPRCVRMARRWALGWAVAAALSYPLTMSNVLPLPVTDLLADPGLLRYGLTIPQARAMLPVLGALGTVVLATRVPRLPGWVPLAIAVFGLLPPLYVGHAASAADHDLAVSALVAHLIAVSVWAGGLGAVVVHFRRSRDLAIVLSRFSTIALCCFAGVAVSGLASAWVRLGAVSDLWQSEYGQFLLAKTGTLALLGLFGWTHRRRTVARVADRGVRHVFVRLAAGEMIVMMVAMGLAVGLARTPPPAAGGDDGRHDRMLEYDLAPFSPGALFTELRPDALIVLLLALPAVGYLVGLRRAGSWPPGRTAAWYAGLALTALALVGGVGGYARAMLSLYALQHVVLAVVAPLLLCLGAPLTLAARATTASSQYGDAWLKPRGLTFLAVLPPVYMVAFPLLYRTGWLPWSLSSHAGHLLTASLFFGAGVLILWVLVGADPLPRPISRRVRLALLAGVMLVQAAVGLFLLLGPPVAAEWFYLVTPENAPDLVSDQRLAGLAYLLALAPLAALAPGLLRPARALLTASA
ncbi:cytochrome c oxidase assembly protein [Nonomuraea purpurea]|uniref:Cytochrome c oxidase assembly protein n=1 Tax=Nonomuraea purpurea TaxID=1849276 RepID=A0ABV8G8G6_9ACTN